MTEDDVIEAARRGWREQVRFFSNSAKPERERWVVAEFLRQLGVSFAECEISSAPEASAIDVSFRDAQFQIKEIVAPSERRHDEFKALLKHAESAKTLNDLVYPFKAKDIIHEDISPKILRHASDHRYPPRSRCKIDLLFYLTYPYGFIGEEHLLLTEIRPLGWRSVSCLLLTKPRVLCYLPDAPDFLR